MVNALLQRIDSLELERKWTNAVEKTIEVILKCMDFLEDKCNLLRETVMPQQSNSNSNNQNTRISQVGNTGEEQEGWEVEPAETKDNAPSQVEVQKAPNNESAP